MEIIYELHGNTLIAELYGELDHHASEKIRNDIDEMMRIYDAKHLIFDFGRVNFMDSAGIGIILGRYRKLEPQGGQVLVHIFVRRTAPKGGLHHHQQLMIG